MFRPLVGKGTISKALNNGKLSYISKTKSGYQMRGVAIFAKACFGHPSPSKRQKL
jgi:hypothetical protein